MLKSRIWHHINLVLVLVLICVVWGIEATTKDKCRRDEVAQHAPKYRIGQKNRTSAGEHTLVLHLSIKTQYFNRDSLVALARRINQDFCNEPRIVAAIFNDHSAARDFTAVYEGSTFERHFPNWRASYRLDRTTGEESVILYAENKNIEDAIEVNLGSTPLRY